MAGGWARDGAVQEQIDDSIADAVKAARAALAGSQAAAGDEAGFCTVCGEAIPEARRLALPGARTCVSCQAERDKRAVAGGINRRGSKDSQLR